MPAALVDARAHAQAADLRLREDRLEDRGVFVENLTALPVASASPRRGRWRGAGVDVATQPMRRCGRVPAHRCGRVPVQMWASPGADVGESRCGRWASLGADVGEPRHRCTHAGARDVQPRPQRNPPARRRCDDSAQFAVSAPVNSIVPSIFCLNREQARRVQTTRAHALTPCRPPPPRPAAFVSYARVCLPRHHFGVRCFRHGTCFMHLTLALPSGARA